MRQPPPDPVRDEIRREVARRSDEMLDAISGRVEEALRRLFERGQVTPDTAVVTFTYDATKRAVEVGGEHVWEGSMVRIGRYGWAWQERWL